MAAPHEPIREDLSVQAARRARGLTTALDTAFRVPGTRFRFGLDPIIGLIPGVGDLLGGLLSSYILLLGAQAGLPKPVLFRMTANIAIDSAVGAIPLLGDLFDLYWRVNTRNLELLQRYHDRPVETRRASTGFVVVLLGVALLLIIGAVWLAVLLVGALFDAIA